MMPLDARPLGDRYSLSRELPLAVEQPADGCGEDTATEHDILVLGILGPVMADTADARYEHHAGRHMSRNVLRVMASAAWHPHVATGSQQLGRLLELVLDVAVHDSRNILIDDLKPDRTGPLPVGIDDEALEACVQSRQHLRIGITKVEQHLGAAGDDIWRPRIERDAPPWSKHCAGRPRAGTPPR